MRVWLVLAMCVVVGCRKSDDAVVVKTPDGTATIDADNETTRIQTKDGTMTFGGGEVPEGFPLSLMPQSQVEHSAHMTQPDGSEVFQVTSTVAGEVKAVADYYEKALKEKGVAVTRTDQSYDGSKSVMLLGESDDAEVNALVLKESGETQTSATITWNVRKK